MIITFEEIDSTNSYIERNIQTLPDHTLVRALYQRFGHGRRDHIWDSPKGENLLFSILLKSPKRPFVYTMCAAYAIVLVLRDYHIAASIKFPNDIYVDDQKICGILTTALYENGYQGTIVGIGLNVYDRLHVSMSDYIDEEIDLEKLMLSIDETFQKLCRQDFDQVVAHINQCSYLQGKSLPYAPYGNVSFDCLNSDGTVSLNNGTKVIKIPLNEINLGNMTQKL